MLPRKALRVAPLVLIVGLLAGCTADTPAITDSSPAINKDETVADDPNLVKVTELPTAVKLPLYDESQRVIGETSINVKYLDSKEIDPSAIKEVLKELSDEEQTSLKDAKWYQYRVEQTYISGDDPTGKTSYYSYRVKPNEPLFMPFFHNEAFEGCEAPNFTESFVELEPHTLCFVTFSLESKEAPKGIYFQTLSAPTAGVPSPEDGVVTEELPAP